MPGSQNLPKSDQNAIFDFKKNTLGVLGMVENSNWLAQKIVDKILKHFSESPRPLQKFLHKPNWAWKPICLVISWSN